MAKLFRRLGNLLRGTRSKEAAVIIPPVYPAEPEPQPVIRQPASPPSVAVRSREPAVGREPAVATEPPVPREPAVPGT